MLIKKVDADRFIHGVKTALACLIGYVFTKAIDFPVDQWLIITILVVMCSQVNVGGMLQKSYMRLLGTLVGSMIALFTLHFFGNNEIAEALTITLSAMLFSYIATGEKSYSEAGTLGAVTVVIILISNNATFIFAFERVFEIILGIIIAALVSQFVLPIHARENLTLNQANAIRKLRNYYQATLLSDSSENVDSYQMLDEDIAKLLVQQRKLAADAIREFLGEKFNLYDFKQLLYAEKEILRAISAMQYAYKISPHVKMLCSNNTIIKGFHLSVCQVLEKVALHIETNEVEKQSVHIPEVTELKAYIFSLGPGEKQEDTVYLYTFLFFAEQVVNQLNAIKKLIFH
ncbi:MAG TPA: FUSC family protein [Gammaproteobacteria bacterium]|jgi:uncharacterized membrane protein YccC|nr:FUSC family protein [Gammaproteobacteria bacterium]